MDEKFDEARQAVHERMLKSKRGEMLDRVMSDFTYKKDMPQEQLDLFGVVVGVFDTFQKNVMRLFESLEEVEGTIIMAHSRHYSAYSDCVRSAERWANTAIANDFETGHLAVEDGTEFPIYNGPSGGDEERHKACDRISKLCFELTTKLVMLLPQGRAISVFITKMQDVRGWLLDAINYYYTPIQEAPPEE